MEDILEGAVVVAVTFPAAVEEAAGVGSPVDTPADRRRDLRAALQDIAVSAQAVVHDLAGDTRQEVPPDTAVVIALEGYLDMAVDTPRGGPQGLAEGIAQAGLPSRVALRPATAVVALHRGINREPVDILRTERQAGFTIAQLAVPSLPDRAPQGLGLVAGLQLAAMEVLSGAMQVNRAVERWLIRVTTIRFQAAVESVLVRAFLHTEAGEETAASAESLESVADLVAVDSVVADLVATVTAGSEMGTAAMEPVGTTTSSVSRFTASIPSSRHVTFRLGMPILAFRHTSLNRT